MYYIIDTLACGVSEVTVYVAVEWEKLEFFKSHSETGNRQLR